MSCGEFGPAEEDFAADPLQVVGRSGGLRPIDIGSAFGAEGFVALAEEAGAGTSLDSHFPPAERTGEIDIVGNGARLLSQDFAFVIVAHRPHAGRVRRSSFLVAGRVLTCVHRHVAVTDPAVICRADHRRAVHPPRHLRKVFADLDARGARGDRLELGTDAGWSVGLEIEHVLRGRTALQIEQHHAFRLARPHARVTALLERQETRKVEDSRREGRVPPLSVFPDASARHTRGEDFPTP